MTFFPQGFLLLIDLANLTIGTVVLLKNPRHLVNRSFFIFILGMCMWAMGISLLYITGNFYFDKLALGGGLLMLFGMTLFTRVFPSDQHIKRRFFLLFIPLSFAVVLLPFNVFIQSIRFDAQGLLVPINGPLFPYYAAVAVGYIFASLFYFWSNYKISRGTARMQLLYLGSGITLFILSLAIFDVLLPLTGIYQLNLVGPAASLLFTLLTGYSIVRHKLMDIRPLIQRSAAYSIIISIVIAGYVAVLLAVEYVSDTARWISSPLLAVIVVLVCVITIPRFERYFQKVTNKYFFKDPYDYGQALADLSTILNENLAFADMLPRLLNELGVIFHPTYLCFVHEVDGLTYDSTGPVFERDSLSEQEVYIVKVTVQAHDQYIGAFLFGPKKSDDPYTAQDHMLLRTFSAHAAVAFEKAELYEKLQVHSRFLEEKVRERTQNLVELQESQRQLFDDISHALQTPITVLKGATELLRAEHGWKDRTMDAVDQSIENLSGLIRELLQLARIDAVLTPEQQEILNLSVVVASIAEYVAVVCERSNIQLQTEIADQIMITGNKKQIEEALTNLLSNAIRFTSSSTQRQITVSLIQADRFIELAVQDTGVGISEERIPFLFERFYRGSDSETNGKTGYGLGLAIVKKIMEQHGGSVRAESQLGMGTKLTLIFPAQTNSTD